MPFSDVEKAVAETYLVADKGLVKLLLATCIAHRLSTPPVFLFIVGPSGGGKSAFMEIVSKVFGTYMISSLTPQTFISGQKRNSGSTSSLLTRIKNGIILMKDFTTILSMHHEARAELMSQLREIYDGKFTKFFGTGEGIIWEGKMSLIACVTDEIYSKRELYSAMGERFIMYYPHQPERKVVTKRSMANVFGQQLRKDTIATIVKKYIDEEIEMVDQEHETEWLPKMEDDLRNRLIDLADFATLSRSPVQRDNFSPSKEVLYKNDPEMPTRFAMQLETIAIAFMVMNRADGKTPTLTQEDENILYKIALDSVTVTRRNVMRKLTEYDTVTTAGLAEDMKYPPTTLRRWLEDLVALDIVEVKKGRAHEKRDDTWKLKQEYRDLITRYEGIKQTFEVLEESPEEEKEPVEMSIEEVDKILDNDTEEDQL